MSRKRWSNVKNDALNAVMEANMKISHVIKYHDPSGTNELFAKFVILRVSFLVARIDEGEVELAALARFYQVV